LPFLIQVPNVKVFGVNRREHETSLREAAMHARALVAIALLTLPSEMSAQLRLPRGGRQTPTQPASLPPEIAPVARSLAYRRSRWSTETYTMVSNIQMPAAAGGTSSTTAGTGTRADYRFTEHFSATVDATASFVGSDVITETAEVGTRFSPLSWDRRLRPFFDVRAAYMHMSDRLTMASLASSDAGVLNQQFFEVGRYSRGAGGVGGIGLEYSLTNTFSLTSELSALRNRMTVYRLVSPTSIPNGTAYWMTSFRYTLGLKFNPVRSLHLAQNPRS
jgi:hypothetical protein